MHVVSGSDWSQIPVEVVGTALITGIGAMFVVLLTRSENAEATLQRATDELCRRAALEQDLVLARERERTARALHDGLGHRLTAIGLSLEFAERARDRDPEAAWREVAVAGGTAGAALADMRRLARAMHPVEIGALSGLESFAAILDVFRKTGLDIRVSVHGDDADVPREHLLLLTRAIQEGLTNVVRHSDATRVDIAVRVSERRAEAVIEDDGAPPPDGADPVAGFGIRSLSERAEDLGGTCAAGYGSSGFRLELGLPLSTGAGV